MKKIGLTGGIGSGKTTIAEIIQHLGYPVYIADKEASFLMETHEGIRKNLTQRFGTAVYTTEGHVNKPVLAKIIFENRKALQEVNRIVHPCVMEAFTAWCHRQTSPLAFCESAILYEGGLEKYFDAIRAALVDPSTEMLNYSYFNGKTDIDNIITACDTLPFMSEKRLVAVKDSKLFEPGRKDDSEKLKDYIPNIPQSTVLCFVEDKADKRSSLYKAVLQRISILNHIFSYIELTLFTCDASLVGAVDA